jgi:uncharacterized RDD family membrane protein YckC
VTLPRPLVSLLRRLAASVYEAVLLAALLLVVGFGLLPLVSPAHPAAAGAGAQASALYIMAPRARTLSATVSFIACGAYCIVLWSGGRRTLAMKTWRLELRTAGDEEVTPQKAALRYLACWVGPLLAIGVYAALRPSGQQRWALVPLVLNYAWACVDPEGLWLQDRLARTRLVASQAVRARGRA